MEHIDVQNDLVIGQVRRCGVDLSCIITERQASIHLLPAPYENISLLFVLMHSR